MVWLTGTVIFKRIFNSVPLRKTISVGTQAPFKLTCASSTFALLVNTTVVDHFKGPKITVFKYSPKKRIRVKNGHRQQYTRLMVDVIGKAEEKTEKKSTTKKSTAKASSTKTEE